MNNTTHRIICLAIAFGLVFGASSPALASAALGAALQEAKTYYVSTTGSDTNPGTSTAPFKTFLKAVSVLGPGDTLQVKPGTYYESLRFTASGAAGAPITVIGNGAIVDMKATKTTGIKITGSYVNLSNFAVTGATDAGIGVSGKHVTVSNNEVYGNVTENGVNRNCGVDTSWSSALKVGVGGENITIENNTVYYNCGEGIAVTRGVNVVVRNNTVYDNFAPNIYVDNSPYSKVLDNLVYCTGAVLRLDGKRPTAIGMGEEYYPDWGAQMHDVLISGNTVRDCGKGIGAFDSDLGGALTNVTITKNYIPSGSGRAIALTNELNKNVVISYNTLFNAPWVDYPEGVTLIGNTIIGNTALTPTPTSTKPAPTPTPAFTPTPITTQPTADMIFANNFESGDFSAWSAKAIAAGDLSVSPSAALVGDYGLQAVINDNTGMYVTDEQPNAEPRYRARFYFDPNSITMADGDAHVIFRGYQGTTKIVLRVVFGYASGTYRIRAGLLNDGTTWKNTAWVPVSDAPHAVELDWRAATGVGANNGGLTLWIDGAQQANITGVDNDTHRIDRARMGPQGGIDTGTRGTCYFDAFESRRQTYIGP